MSAPFFSILVPTRNRPDLAATCARSVLALDPPSAELLVCDQSDGEETRRAVEAAAAGDVRVRVVSVSGRGRSRALNGGIPEARGRWIVMTDDDCEPVPGWLQAFELEADRAPARAGIVGRVLAGPAEPGLAPPPSTLEDPEPADYAGRIDRDVVYPNFAVPKAVFDEIGLFDERLGVGTRIPGGEDNDFGYRMLRAGWKILYRPAPAVIHRAWRTHEARLALRRDYGIGQGGFYAKHVLRADPFIAWRFAKDLVRNGRYLLGALARGRIHDARGSARFLSGLPVGFLRYALGRSS